MWYVVWGTPANPTQLRKYLAKQKAANREKRRGLTADSLRPGDSAIRRVMVNLIADAALSRRAWVGMTPPLFRLTTSDSIKLFKELYISSLLSLV